MNLTSLADLDFSAFAAANAWMSAGYHTFIILVSPDLLGCTPSRRSDEPEKPVYWSTTQMGESVEFMPDAHGTMALLRSWILVL